MRLVTGLLLLSIVVAGTALAAPSVSSTTGAITHGGSLVISGTDFGSKSPAAPLWWDNAEGPADTTLVATSGDITGVISSLAEGAKHYNDAWPSGVTQSAGAANIRYRAAPYRSVAAPHSRSTKFITGGHDDEGECLGSEVAQNVGITVSDGSTTKAVWVVYYYLTLDPLWPSYQSASNYKYHNWETVSPFRMVPPFERVRSLTQI